MPNHCDNVLRISATTPEELEQILDLLGKDEGGNQDFKFTNVIPYPNEYAVLDKEYNELGYVEWKKKYGDKPDGYNSGGYEWCSNNWGTKWSAYDVKVKARTYLSVELSYLTAWCPATPVISALHKKFPTASFESEYFERGAAFCGGAVWVAKDAEDNEEEETWEAGAPEREWHGEYRGTRGG